MRPALGRSAEGRGPDRPRPRTGGGAAAAAHPRPRRPSPGPRLRQPRQPRPAGKSGAATAARRTRHIDCAGIGEDAGQVLITRLGGNQRMSGMKSWKAWAALLLLAAATL